MAQDDLFGAPAGWYPDPLGLPQLRWWNNHAWTEQTSAARQPIVMQDTKFAWADDEELPTRREERERERQRDDREPAKTVAPTAETLRELEPPRAFTKINQPDPEPVRVAQEQVAAEPVVPLTQPAAPAAAPATPTVESIFANMTATEQPAPSFSALFDAQPAATAPVSTATSGESLDDLFGAGTRRTATAARTPLTPAESASRTTTLGGNPVNSTGPAWLISMVPLFQLVTALLLITTLGMGGSVYIYLAILVVPYFFVIGLAYLDYRTLQKAGHEHPAHWAWAFLTAPVYQLMRARSVIRETGKGIGPVLVWFGLGFLHLASVIAIPGLLISVVPSVFTAQIEQSVQADALLISNTQMTVDCPETPPVLQGEQIKCTSVNANGNTNNVIVRLERANGWINWQVIDWGVFSMTNNAGG